MIYYLETNALYTFSNKLKDLKDVSYTSFLSIFEIISSIDENEYNFRKKVLTNIYESNINIIWDTPREKISEAFSEVIVYDKLKLSLQKIMKIIIENKPFEDSNIICNKQDLDHSLTDIIYFDKGLLNLERDMRRDE